MTTRGRVGGATTTGTGAGTAIGGGGTVVGGRTRLSAAPLLYSSTVNRRAACLFAR